MAKDWSTDFRSESARQQVEDMFREAAAVPAAERIPEPFEGVCRLPNSATLYRQKNGAGGYTYWSDEIGCGVMVWDTCLVGEDTLLAAMAEEHRRRISEQVAKRKAEREA